MGKSIAIFLVIFSLLAPKGLFAHGGYGYSQAALTYYGKTDLRMNYQTGARLGLALQDEPFRFGLTYRDDNWYIPVNSVIPLTFFSLKKWNIGDSTTNTKWALLTSSLNGFSIGVSDLFFSAMAGHHLEIYAPKPGVSEILDLRLHVYLVEVSLYQRFSSVSSLNGAGFAVGLSHIFD